MSATERKHAPSAVREAQLRALKAVKPKVSQLPLKQQPVSGHGQAAVRLATPPHSYEVVPNYAPNNAPNQIMQNVADAETTLESLRAALKKRTADVDGMSGIQGLTRNFRLCDRNRNGVLDLDEFAMCVALCKIGVSADQVSKLFAFFDRDGSGAIECALCRLLAQPQTCRVMRVGRFGWDLLTDERLAARLPAATTSSCAPCAARSRPLAARLSFRSSTLSTEWVMATACSAWRTSRRTTT